MNQHAPRAPAPYYLSIGDEIEIFQAAYDCRLPVLLKGPTGCGKTRFVEYMAHTLMKDEKEGVPGNLITVACHEDLTGSDLVGRYLIKGDETVDIRGVEGELRPQQDATLVIRRADGSVKEVPLLLRIETPIEVDYYQHGGILPFVLREILGKAGPSVRAAA